MTTYLRLTEKDQRDRFYQECARLGYEYVPSWPSVDGPWDDPGYPDKMPEEQREQVRQYARKGIRPSDFRDQHPDFKYLRVRK